MRTAGMAALIAIATIAAPAPQAASPRASRLFKDSRQTLAIARAQGRRDVTLLVAAVPGGAVTVAQQASSLGGDVRYRDDDLGYLRVRLPLDRVNEFVESDQIDAVAADRDDSYPGRLTPGSPPPSGSAPAHADPQPWLTGQGASTGGASAPQPAWPPVWGAYPLEHPYSPLGDIDAAAFLKAHPTFDGRGVGIAVLDGNIDLLLPEFQTAYTLDGRRVPKIADFLNVTDPRDDAALLPQWVDMHEVVVASGRRVRIGAKTFTTPRDGTFRIGIFSERKFNSADYDVWGQDIDRNGNPRGDDGEFGVLWDEQTNDVWVDANRDLSFADQKAMTDYIKRQDVGIFGTDNPATPLRESVGFTVQTDPVNKFISINLGMFGHATIIMGSVIGNREPHGRLTGVAPGARIVSMYWGIGVAHAMVEGLIAAFKHPLVDLIVLEQHVGVATIPYLLADAHHPISVIAQRLTDKYHKLLFVPGSNAPGFGIVGEDGLAPGVMSVGGYQHKESYRLNAGFVPEAADNMHWGALSHGPSGIGALKPDLLAPSGQMSTYPGYRRGDKMDYVIPGLFELPPGYTVDGGTSTATPMAAGATALVVSAAKQTQVPVDAARLKAALLGSARYIPRLAAHEQGSGLIQVGAAYSLLKTLQTAPAITIESRAPVRTRLSHLLRTPDEGVGIYEREGWSVGDRGSRTIRLTRTSGPAGSLRCTLAWLGNDGTFSSASSIDLPLNQSVDLPVAIAVKDAGAHTATLTIDHPSVPGHIARVLNSVIAPLRLTRENGYRASADVTLPRPGDRGVFIDVPPGVGALSVAATSSDGKVRVTVISPDREQLWRADGTVARPEPGVWEINVSMNEMARDYDPARANPLKPAAVHVTASIAGVTLSTSTARPAASSNTVNTGGIVDLPITLTNQFGELQASAVSTSLGGAVHVRREIARGEQQLSEVIVPKGTALLRARISEVADEGADLDLYLLDCTEPERPAADAAPPKERDKDNRSPIVPGPTCTPRAKAAGVGRDGEVTIVDPAPGRWAIVVDAYAVPAGKTAYTYMDVFTHPAIGALSVADSAESRGPQASWTTTAHAWVASLPQGARTPQAFITVMSPDVKPSAGVPVPVGVLDVPIAGATQAPSTGGGR